MKKVFVFIVFWLVQPIMVLAQQWETILSDSVHLCRGFINENNTAEFVGYSGNDGIYVKLFDNGQYESNIFSAPEGKRLVFDNLIPLENEGYFFSGNIYNDGSVTGELKVVILDESLIIVKEQTIQVTDGFHGFQGSAAVKDDDGTIVLLATAKRESPDIPGSYEYRGVLFRFSQEGDCLNSRYLIAAAPNPICYMSQIYNQKLINDPYNSQIIVMAPGRNGLQSLLYFDYDFNLVENYYIEDPSISVWNSSRYVEDFYSNYWYNENEMLIVATQQDSTGMNHPHLLIGRTNREGQITEKTEINKQDTLMYFNRLEGMAHANDSTIYILAKCNTEDWLEPFYPQIYLINQEREVLGSVCLWQDLDCDPWIVLSTSDEGCVVVTNPSSLFFEDTPPIIRRFSREDFHPVWSIKEKPKQEILSSVYPNPATEEIHIDLTNIPTNGSVHLRIANMMGQTFIDRIIRGTGNLLTVGVIALPAGTYSYCLYNKDEIIVKGKFVKL